MVGWKYAWIVDSYSAVMLHDDSGAKPATTPATPAKPLLRRSWSRRSWTRRPGAARRRQSRQLEAVTTDDEDDLRARPFDRKSLSPFDLSPAEIDILKRALTDAAANKPEIKLDDWGPKIDPLARARGARVAEKQKAASVAYLATAATEPGAVKTESGMIIKEVKAGTGASPKATDTVKVNYRGTLVDGTEFDSSYKRNEPASFPLNGVIPCWTEGVQRMKVGGKSMLICPSNLAYGDQGRPSIPGGATLVFEIELLEIGGGK